MPSPDEATSASAISSPADGPGSPIGHDFGPDEAQLEIECLGCGDSFGVVSDAVAAGNDSICPAWLADRRAAGQSDVDIARALASATGREPGSFKL